MFGIKRPTFLGIDFGTSSIKAVELLVENEQIRLKNYAEISLVALGQQDADTVQGKYDAALTVYLRALLERLRPTSREVYVAMPAFIGLVALVDFPRMDIKELQDAIKFEAHKYIPSPLEEVALSWEIVGETVVPEGEVGKETSKFEVLLVAALNKEVERYESYIQAVGYEMKLLELETFSLVRSIVGNDQGVYLIADIGSRATNVVLVDKGLVKVSRNVDVGGRDVTQALAEALHITEGEAETLKKSGKDYLYAPDTKVVLPPLEAIGIEMGRIIAMHEKKHPERPIDGIILSGGTASLAGIDTYYSAMFSLPVTNGDPWQRVLFPKELESAIARMGTAYSVALGLALHGAMRLTGKKTEWKAQPQGNRWEQVLTRLKQPIGGSSE